MPAVAAEIAVPLPFSTPVMLVVRVIAGVVVAFATVPAKPFAETTETVCTVPEVPSAEASKNTEPRLSLAYSFLSVMLKFGKRFKGGGF